MHINRKKSLLLWANYIKTMKKLHIITPVKDSIHTTLDTIKAVMLSRVSIPYLYTVYNDNSTPENTAQLEEARKKYGFRLIHVNSLTPHPSPNYLFVLQHAQKEAIDNQAALCIVESDVTVMPDTLQQLYEGACSSAECGIASAVTVDEKGVINYPYLYAKGWEGRVVDNSRHQSFCCSLLTLDLLRKFDFRQLNPEKNWFDVTISHQSLALGFHNYLFTTLPVVHRPHQSRPWKQLKYKNPLLYYWKKFTKGLDRI